MLWNPSVVAIIIFVITFALIVTDRFHRTPCALAGGVAMIALNIVPQEHAFHAVDWNVIFLLIGMMIIASAMSKAGTFQWLAIRLAKAAGGEPSRLLIILSLSLAVMSAFLDNVTAVILFATVTIYIASLLRVSPMPFLVAEMLASEVGGGATLIGDPPNIMIGSAVGLDFVAFIINLAPIVLVLLVIFVPTIWLLFREELQTDPELKELILQLDESEAIEDIDLLRKSLGVLGFVTVGFLFHGALGYEPATIALLGAVVLMFIGGQEIQDVLQDVEWTTIFFFIGLFIAVEGLVAVGLIERLATALLGLTGENLTLTTIGLLWMSGIISGIVDNIPYTAAMIPLVKELGRHMAVEPLWWSLALGACLGGNYTLIGCASNVTVADISARAGHPISFTYFLKYGVIVTTEMLLVSTVYIWLRYLL